MDKLLNLELTLTNAVRGQEYTPEEVRKNIGTHASDSVLSRYSAEFMLLPSLLSEVDRVTVESIIDVLEKKKKCRRSVGYI